MRRKICLILSTLLIVSSAFVGCKRESDSGKIFYIISERYGLIMPVDVYIIKGGYMEDYWDKDKELTVKLNKSNNYLATHYFRNKSETVSGELGKGCLEVDMSLLKITSKYDGEQYKYYSEYFGAKTLVEFVAHLSFYKTLHIKMEEKSDTYKITYYAQNQTGVIETPIIFDDLRVMNEIKRVVEIPKNDIQEIEYFV